MEHDDYKFKMEELCMERRIPESLQEVATEMAKVGRTEYRTSRRPRWKEYTLVKYKEKKVVSKEKIWIDESKIFPLDEDFFWEPEVELKIEKAA